MIVPPTTEQLREMSAAPCPYWHNHTNPPATPASQEHTTEPVTCEDCIHFRPPIAAMGRCMHDARHGYFFAAERHRCADHTSEVETKPEAAS